MPTARRFAVPLLVPLLVAVTLILSTVAYLLGGSPLGRERGVTYADAPADGRNSPITVVVIDAGHGGAQG